MLSKQEANEQVKKYREFADRTLVPQLNEFEKARD